MTTLTPIGARLQIALEAEYLRMQNDWFFKWHYIGGENVVEIDGFDGRMIRYAGIKFSGSARSVYWGAIQVYAQRKVGELFDELEVELQRYPIGIRAKALNEAKSLISLFVGKIRKSAIEKDRVLRGNGIEFPLPQDLGGWVGARVTEIESRATGLRRIYCDLEVIKDGDLAVLDHMLNDRVSLVKKDGSVFRQDISCLVTKGRIQIHDATLPIEVGDHLIRNLPNGLAEDYIVDNPQLHSGLDDGPYFIVDVHRSDEKVASPQTIIEHVTAHISGNNPRLTVGIDNSVNIANELQHSAVASFVEQVKSHISSLPEPQRSEIAVPLKLLEDEIRRGSPEPSKLQAALRSMLAIVENAGGNLLAAGIQAMILRML